MAQLMRVVRQLIKSPQTGRCQLCQSTRFLCDSGGFSRENYIPGRIRRRLEQRNLTVDDLAPRYTSKDVESTTPHSSSERKLQTELENSVMDTNKEVEFPSDLIRVKTAVHQQEKSNERKKDVDTRTTSVVLFPGQGSQFVGMGRTLLKYPGVVDLYAEASQFLGYDLLSLCLNGPKEKLDMTLYCQPAVFISSLAALEKLKEEHPGVVESCVATAGYSIGEYTALVFSGAIPFEAGLELVAIRAKVMQDASDAVAGGMLSVYINRETKIRTAMVAAKEYCRKKLQIEEPVCRVANYACTNIQVIAGHEEALDFIQHFGKEWGIQRTKRLPVSGAFHTELMKLSSSCGQFRNMVLRQTLEKPSIPVYSNVTGMKMPLATQKIKSLLMQQLSKPVLWEQTMHSVYKRPAEVAYPNTYEVGPGNQLGIMLKSCNGKAHNHYYNISG